MADFTTIKNPGLHFNTKLYTGNGSTQSLTGVGFQPDFTWIKRRDSSAGNKLTNSLRGTNYHLVSNNTNAPNLTDYEIQGAELLSQEQTIFIDYQRDVDEQSMPAYFVQLLIYQMAWHLAEPVTDQTTKSEYWKNVALGTPLESLRGGYFRQATAIDGSGQSSQVLADYVLVDVR